MSYDLPPVEIQEGIAFIGVFHGEGIVRLERLYRHIRPWFDFVCVALQEPTYDEKNLSGVWADKVLVHKLYGKAEPSFAELNAKVMDAGYLWTFNLDGDEFADLSLLASLGKAIKDQTIGSVGAARVPRLNTFGLRDGTVIPGFSEDTIRLMTANVKRSAIVHAPPQGFASQPILWDSYGAIRQHRTVEEFIRDHLRYYEQSFAKDESAYGMLVTKEYLVLLWNVLNSFLSEADAIDEINSEKALGIIEKALHPEVAWLEHDARQSNDI